MMVLLHFQEILKWINNFWFSRHLKLVKILKCIYSPIDSHIFSNILLALSDEHEIANRPICKILSTWKSWFSTSEANSQIGFSALGKWKQYLWIVSNNSVYSEKTFNVNLSTALLTLLSKIHILSEHACTDKLIIAWFCCPIALTIHSSASIT